jgi:hypothetical protein
MIAKHVLQNEKGHYHDVVGIRVNKHDGGSEYIPVDLRRTKIHTHKENEVDLAVISFSLNQKQFDFKLIPEYIIPDQQVMKQLEISEGDDVFFSGLFESLWPTEKPTNY